METRGSVTFLDALNCCPTFILIPAVHVWNHACLSCESWYPLASIPKVCRSDDSTSRYLLFVPCVGLVFSSSSNSRNLDYRAGFMQPRWPSQCRLCFTVKSAVDSSSVLITAYVDEMRSFHTGTLSLQVWS